MLLVLAARAGLKPTLGLAALRSDAPDVAKAIVPASTQIVPFTKPEPNAADS